MGPFKTEAVVLRSIRYGEADRILHLYTRARGRISGFAKGSRRLHSRLAGRLEPYQPVQLELHEGRSDLFTVTGARILAPTPGLRGSAVALDVAGRCCDAVGRLFATEEPHPEVFNLLCNLLLLIDRCPERAGWPLSLAFHLKLLVAAGIAPRIGSCVGCGYGRVEVFSAAAGGTLCRRCVALSRGYRFKIAAETRAFMATALARPLAEAPAAQARSLREAERAVVEIAAYHGHVRLLPPFAHYLRPRESAEVAA